MKALFLCAGEGTRLRPYTEQLAKPAIPFLGVPLLHHIWHSLEPLKISHLTVNLHHRPKDVMQIAKMISSISNPVELFFSDESERLLDSGGGVNKAKGFLFPKRWNTKSDFLVANGDEVFFLHDEADLFRFASAHQSQDALATLLVTEHAEVGKRFGGVFVKQSNENADHAQIQTFSKTPVVGLKGWHYVGVMLLSSRIFDYMNPTVQPENILYDVLLKGIKADETVLAFPSKMDWFEVGNPKDFLLATSQVLDFLEKPSSAPWVESLSSRIRWCYLQDPMIEREDHALLQRLQLKLKQLKDG